MTSGNLQIHYCSVLWLLASTCIIRTSSMEGKHSAVSTFTLIIQRPHIAGGILIIPLDHTVQLNQCSTKDIARNIIRLQYGRHSKHLIMRAANTIEHKEWITAIASSLASIQATQVQTRAAAHASEPMSRASVTAQTTTEDDRAVTASIPSRLSQSLYAIKRLADGYDNLAVQWTQVATETRQFSHEIASLQPPCIGPARCSTTLTAC